MPSEERMRLPPALRGRNGLARGLLAIDRETARRLVQSIGARTVGDLYHRCIGESGLDFGEEASSTAARLQHLSQLQQRARHFLTKGGHLDEDGSHHIANALYSTLRSIEAMFDGDEVRAVEAFFDPEVDRVLAQLSLEEKESGMAPENGHSTSKIHHVASEAPAGEMHHIPRSPIQPPRPLAVRRSPRISRVQTTVQGGSSGSQSARGPSEPRSALPVVNQWTTPARPHPLPACLRLPFVTAIDNCRYSQERSRGLDSTSHGGMLIRVASSGPPSTHASARSGVSHVTTSRHPREGRPARSISLSMDAASCGQGATRTSPEPQRVPSLPVQEMTRGTRDHWQERETDPALPSWSSPRLRHEIDSGRVALQGYHLNTHGFEELVQSMKRGTSLRSIALCECGVTPGMGRLMAKSLSCCVTLQELKLPGNALDDAAASLLLHFTRHLPGLRTVDFSSNPIGDTRDLGRSLWTALVGTPSWAMLRALEIAAVTRPGQPASPTDMRRVPRGTHSASMAQLRDISLAHTRIGDTVATALGWALPHSPALRGLNVRNTCIMWIGSRVLLEGVRLSCSLEHLDIGRCSLGEEGGLALAEAVAAHPSLQTLHADGCDMSAAAGFMLAEALRFNTTLRALALDQNPFGPVAAKRIFAALRGSSTTHTMTDCVSLPQRRPALPRSGGEMRTTARPDVIVALIGAAREQLQSLHAGNSGMWTPVSDPSDAGQTPETRNRDIQGRRTTTAMAAPAHHHTAAMAIDPEVFQFGDQLQYCFDAGLPDGNYRLQLHRFRDHCLAEMLQHRCRRQNATWRGPRWDRAPLPAESIMAGMWEIPRYGCLSFEFAGAHAQLDQRMNRRAEATEEGGVTTGARTWRRVRVALKGLQTFRRAKFNARTRRKSIADIAGELLPPPHGEKRGRAMLRFLLLLQEGSTDVECMRRLIARHVRDEEEWGSIWLDDKMVATHTDYYDESWLARHSTGTRVQVDIPTSIIVHQQHFVLSLHQPRSRRLARFLLDASAAMDTTGEVENVMTTDTVRRIRYEGKPVVLRDWRTQNPIESAFPLKRPGRRGGPGLGVTVAASPAQSSPSGSSTSSRMSMGGWSIPTRGTFSCDLDAHCTLRLGSDRIRVNLSDDGDRKLLAQAWVWSNAHPDVFLWDICVDGEECDSFVSIIGRLAARIRVAVRAGTSSSHHDDGRGGIFASAAADWDGVAKQLAALRDEEKQDDDARASSHKAGPAQVVQPTSPWWERALPTSGLVEFDIMIARPLFAAQAVTHSLLEFDLSDSAQWNVATLIRARALLSMSAVAYPTATLEKHLSSIGVRLLDDQDGALWWGGPRVILPHPEVDGSASVPKRPADRQTSLRLTSAGRRRGQGATDAAPMFPLRLVEDARRREERLVRVDLDGASVPLSAVASPGFAFPRHGTLKMSFFWPSLAPLVSEEELGALLDELMAQPNDQERCALLRSCLRTTPPSPRAKATRSPRGGSITRKADALRAWNRFGGTRQDTTVGVGRRRQSQSGPMKELSSDEEDETVPEVRVARGRGRPSVSPSVAPSRSLADSEDDSGEFGYLWALYGIGARKDGLEVFFTTCVTDVLIQHCVS